MIRMHSPLLHKRSPLLVFVVSVLLLTGCMFVVAPDRAEAGVVPDATVDAFCVTVPRGFYSLMYVNNGANNQTINITAPGTTQVNITFRNELWFCRNRPSPYRNPLPGSWALMTDNYQILDENGVNRLVSPARTSTLTYPSDPVARRSPALNKEMVSTNISARLNVSGWANGSTHRLCTNWGETSYASQPFYDPVAAPCITVTIRYTYWQLNATSSVKATALPGETINWTHTLRNAGPAATSGNIVSNIGTSANFSNGWAATLSQTTVSTSIASGASVRAFPAASTTYTVTAADVGKTLCQWVQFDPSNSYGGRNGRSTSACVTINAPPPPPLNYDLTPFVTTTDADGLVAPGEIVTFNYTISKTGTTDSPLIAMAVKEFLVDPGLSFPNTSKNNVSGCIADYSIPCRRDVSLAPQVISTASYTVVSNTTRDVNTAGFAPGSMLCQILAIDPAGSSAPGNLWSAPACVTVGTSPYFQVFNGDVLAGALFASECLPTATPSGTIRAFNKGGASYAGSGVQIAAFSAGTVQGFVSASITGLSAAANPKAPVGLTFANTPADPTKPYGGEFAQHVCLPDYWSYRTSVQAGGHTIASPSINKNNGQIVFVDGDVYIKADGSGRGPNFVGSGWDAKDMPYFWVVASGDIYIDSQVETMDGVYVALPRNATDGGRIYTCAVDDGAGGLKKPTSQDMVQRCNQQLVVNGAFVAKQVKLLRTFGTLEGSTTSDTPSSTQAAEVFNFSPEVWLKSPVVIPSTTLKYDYVTSLPPVL